MKITDEYYQMLTAQFLLKLKGYTLIARNRYLLLINKDLTEEEYCLYTFIYDILADWSPTHLSYGIFEFNPPITSSHFQWGESKIRRIFNSLIKKGFIVSLGNKKYSVIGFDLRRYVTKRSIDFNFYEELKKEVTKHKEQLDKLIL